MPTVATMAVRRVLHVRGAENLDISRIKCWKLHPELVPAKIQRKVRGAEGDEELGAIEICSVEPLDPLSCLGNENFDKQFPVFGKKVVVQNKYAPLDTDNDKWDPDGIKTVCPPLVTT